MADSYSVIHTCIHAYIRTCIYIYILTYLPTYVRTYVRVYGCIYIHTYYDDIYIYAGLVQRRLLQLRHQRRGEGPGDGDAGTRMTTRLTFDNGV